MSLPQTLQHAQKLIVSFLCFCNGDPFGRRLTIREAAGLLRVSESTVRNAIGSGRMRAYRFGVRGGSIRIGRADLEDYMASCATAARPTGRAAGRADGGLFKSLDAGRLLAAWRRQGVFDGRPNECSAPSTQPS